MRSGGDEEVGNTPSVSAARFGDGGHDLSVAPGRGGVEGERLEGRLHLLESGLAASTLGTRGSEMWPGCQLGEGDRADGGILGEGSGHRRVVPVDDDRGVEQAR